MLTWYAAILVAPCVTMTNQEKETCMLVWKQGMLYTLEIWQLRHKLHDFHCYSNLIHYKRPYQIRYRKLSNYQTHALPNHVTAVIKKCFYMDRILYMIKYYYNFARVLHDVIYQV
jgi:hypothetical protein